MAHPATPETTARARRPLSALLGGILVSGLTLVAGCDLACTEAGCDRDGLRVSATRADGHPLAEGMYDIELRADTDVYRAECSLSALAEGSCEFDAMVEDPEQDVSLTVAGDDVPRDIRIEVRRAQLNSHTIDLTGPATVNLAIALDGIMIASTDLSPTYEREEPNGPQCGACEHSEYYVDLLPPTAKP